MGNALLAGFWPVRVSFLGEEGDLRTDGGLVDLGQRVEIDLIPQFIWPHFGSLCSCELGLRQIVLVQ